MAETSTRPVKRKRLAINDCANVMKALGDQTRMQILQLLLNGELTVLEIAGQLKMDQPHVSHHLTVLRNAGLVVPERQGRYISYSIHPSIRKLDDKRLDFGCCALEFR